VFDFRLLGLEVRWRVLPSNAAPGHTVRSLAYDMGAQVGCGAPRGRKLRAPPGRRIHARPGGGWTE